MPKKDDYIEELEDVIRRMLTPFKNIRFGVVIKALTGHEVVEFDRKSAKHAQLLKKLCKAAEIASVAVTAAGGIHRPRPNEVGNDLEAYVENALKAVGYSDVCKPTGKSGKGKTVGYPDREFTADGTTVYLEVKSYAEASLDSTMRSFYFSPSQDFKVNKSGLHLVIAFEVLRKADVFFVGGWKILTVDQLMVDVKYEFNSDNRRLYANNAILASKKFDYSKR